MPAPAPTPPRSPTRGRRPNPILLLALTWLLARLVGRLVGWRYDPFAEGLVVGKLVVDLALWLAIATLVGLVMTRLAGGARPRGATRTGPSAPPR